MCSHSPAAPTSSSPTHSSMCSNIINKATFPLAPWPLPHFFFDSYTNPWVGKQAQNELEKWHTTHTSGCVDVSVHFTQSNKLVQCPWLFGREKCFAWWLIFFLWGFRKLNLICYIHMDSLITLHVKWIKGQLRNKAETNQTWIQMSRLLELPVP